MFLERLLIFSASALRRPRQHTTAYRFRWYYYQQLSYEADDDVLSFRFYLRRTHIHINYQSSSEYVRNLNLPREDNSFQPNLSIGFIVSYQQRLQIS